MSCNGGETTGDTEHSSDYWLVRILLRIMILTQLVDSESHFILKLKCKLHNIAEILIELDESLPELRIILPPASSRAQLQMLFGSQIVLSYLSELGLKDCLPCCSVTSDQGRDTHPLPL